MASLEMAPPLSPNASLMAWDIVAITNLLFTPDFHHGLLGAILTPFGSWTIAIFVSTRSVRKLCMILLFLRKIDKSSIALIHYLLGIRYMKKSHSMS